MAGYAGYSKSNNAVAAEREGKMVATKFAAWVKRWKRYRGCTARDVAAALSPCEWHHTSKRYNCTDYYDPCELVELDVRQKLERAIKTRKLLTSLLKKAGGCIHITMASGEHWYDIDEKTFFDPYSTTDLARALLCAKYGKMPIQGGNDNYWVECVFENEILRENGIPALHEIPEKFRGDAYVRFNQELENI